MKILKSRSISFFLIGALLMQAAPTIAAEALFKKWGQDIKKGGEKFVKGVKDIGQKTKEGFENLGTQIKEKFDEFSAKTTPQLIDQLLKQVEKLKGQFKQFGGRIITGNLPDKDKAMVFATVIAIVTLTGLVVGASLLKMKQEQEAAIERKAKEISEQVSGGIKGTFEKAKAQLQDFEDSLKSLRDCLKSGKCSQGQKQFLYGAAITVAALALLAVGIGAGALFYKKYKKDQAEALAAAEQAEQEAKATAEQAAAAAKAAELAAQNETDTKRKAALSVQAAQKEKEAAAAQVDAVQAEKEKLEQQEQAITLQIAQTEGDETTVAAQKEELQRIQGKLVFTQAAQVAAEKEQQRAAMQEAEAQRKAIAAAAQAAQEKAAAEERARKAQEAEAKAKAEALAKRERTVMSELKNIASYKLSTAKNNVQTYFEKTIKPAADNILIEASMHVRNAYNQAEDLSKELKKASIEMKENIIDSIETQLKTAKEQSQKLLTMLKQSGTAFIDGTLEQLFNIKLSYIDPAMKQIQDYAGRIGKSLNPLSSLRINSQITALTNEINEIMKDVTRITGNTSEAIKQAAQLAAARASSGGIFDFRSQADREEEFQETYPLGYAAQELFNKYNEYYPQIVENVNALKLASVGIALKATSNVVAGLLSAVSTLNSSLGSFGKVLVSDQLAASVDKLSEQFTALGEKLRNTLAIKPLVMEKLSTNEAVWEIAKGYTYRVGTSLPTLVQEQLAKITDAYNSKITPALDKIWVQKDKLMSEISNAASAIKEEVQKQLSTESNLLGKTLHSPAILARAVGSVVSTIKGSINAILTNTADIVGNVGVMLLGGQQLGLILNKAMGGKLINPDLVTGIEDVNSTVKEIQSTVAGMKSGVDSSFKVAIPA